MTLSSLDVTTHESSFVLELMGGNCPPSQQYRELTTNAIEALGSAGGDVAWEIVTRDGTPKLAVVDTGCGMDRDALVANVRQLAYSGKDQRIGANFGWGGRIASASRNRAGVEYTSLVAGAACAHRAVLHQDPDTGRFRLVDLAEDGTGVEAVAIDTLPERIRVAGHGTVVTLLGNHAADDTTTPPGDLHGSKWLTSYLNGRFFRLPATVKLTAPERSGRSRGTLRSRAIVGLEHYLRSSAVAHGTVPLTGASAHWWIVADGANAKWKDAAAVTGQIGVLHGDELYERFTGNDGYRKLISFGVPFSKVQSRVAIIVEPHAALPNAERTALLIDGNPLPWSLWAGEFRAALPVDIEELMDAPSAAQTDVRAAIARRLSKLAALWQPSKFVANPDGTAASAAARTRSRGDRNSAPGDGDRTGPKVPRQPKRLPTGTSGNGRGADRAAGTDTLTEADLPTVMWVSASDGTRDAAFLVDRAANYNADARTLTVSADFRAIADLERFFAKEFSATTTAARKLVESKVREYVAMALVEHVLGIESLAGSAAWTSDDVELATSEEALTGAVMQRYLATGQIRNALKRALG